MSRPDKKTLLLMLSVIVLTVGAATVLYTTGMIDLLTSKQRLLDYIQEYEQNAAIIFIGFQILQVVAAPLPGEVTGFVGGILFGPWWGVVYSTIGLAIGSWIAFLLARWLGRPIVERLVKRETIDRYDYVMKHKGLLLAFLLFLIPGFPKDILCYILGLGHMRQRDFLLISISGRLFGTVLLTLGGAFFRDSHYVALFTVVGIGLLIFLFAMIYHKRLEILIRRIAISNRRKRDKTRT